MNNFRNEKRPAIRAWNQVNHMNDVGEKKAQQYFNGLEEMEKLNITIVLQRIAVKGIDFVRAEVNRELQVSLTK